MADVQRPKPMLRYFIWKRKKSASLPGSSVRTPADAFPRLCDDKLPCDRPIDVSEHYADRKVKINELRIALRECGVLRPEATDGSDHSASDRVPGVNTPASATLASNAMLVCRVCASKQRLLIDGS